MANDRMWLRCKVCNGYVWLGKYYPSSGWYMSNVHITQSDLAKHTYCYAPIGELAGITNPLFDVVYESTMSPEEWRDAIKE